MARWAWLVAVAAGCAAAFDPRAVVLVGTLTAASGAGVAWYRGRRVPLAWSRGAWRAGVPASLLLAAGAAPQLRGGAVATSATLLGLLVVAGALVALTPAASAQGRLAGLSQAATAGVLVAVAGLGVLTLLGRTLDQGVGLAAVELSLAVATLQLLHRRRRDALDGGGQAEGYLALGLLAVTVARVTELLLAAGILPAAGGPRLVGAITAAGLAALGVALVDPRLARPSAARTSVSNRVGRYELLLSAVAVAAGPTVIAWQAVTADVVPVALVAVALGPALPALAHLVLLVRDRVERSERALHDALTGLATEPVFADRLERAVAAGRRSGRGVAVAFLDLDGFKGINDTVGHDAGDAVLRAVAGRLLGAVRDEDTVARRSGDEFLVLLPGVDLAEDAERVAHKLAEEVADGIEVGAETLHVGVSVGLALWPRDAQTPEELVRHADAAMYEAKGAVGDRVRWASTATTVRARVTAQLRAELEAAIAADELEVVLQPALDLADHHVVRLHALVRWHHPQLGVLTPRVFLPLLVDPQVARSLDLAAVATAVSSVRRCQQRGSIDVPVVATLTAATATWAELPRRIGRTLQEVGWSPRQLVLAVDESTVRSSADRLLAVAAELDDLGVRLLITNVGAGPIDLATYAALPLAGVETAASLANTGARFGARTVLRAVAALSAATGVPAAAAGLLGPAALTDCREAGYEVGRGSYLGAPRDVATIEARLAAGAKAGHDPRRVPGATLGAGQPDLQPEPVVAETLAALLRPDGEAPPDAVDDLLRRLAGERVAVPSAPRLVS